MASIPGNATLVKAVSESSQDLAGFEEDVHEPTGNSPTLHVDETGMRVRGTRQRLHVAGTKIFAGYGHHRKRGIPQKQGLQNRVNH